MAPIVLGYWNIRGLVQPVRNLLEYVGEEYEDRLYEFDMTDLTDIVKLQGKWPADKAVFASGADGGPVMEFPNLPYLLENQPDGKTLKFTQSAAILKHFARRHGLVVEGEENVFRMEMYEEQALDLKQMIAGYCYGNPMTMLRYPNYSEDIKSLFKQWEKVLEGKEWIMGTKLTYVDFLLFEYLDWHVPMKADIFDDFANLQAYMTRFKALPKLAEYFASDRYHAWPLVSPYAKTYGYFK